MGLGEEGVTTRFGGSPSLYQRKLLVNPHLGSCWLPVWQLSLGLSDWTCLMARPNELFIAWLTGSGFSMSLEESLKRGLQT